MPENNQNDGPNRLLLFALKRAEEQLSRDFNYVSSINNDQELIDSIYETLVIVSQAIENAERNPYKE